MREYKPVAVPGAAFNFCRYGVSLILWAGYFWRWPELVVLSFVILALSAILKIERAPMIYFYKNTVDKLFPSPVVILDEHAMRFAHTLGSLLTLTCVILLYTAEGWGWRLVIVAAVLKTIGALGYCSGVKLYNCLNSDTCCSFLRKRHV